MMNKSQCYITSAGETQTFAYEKLANILIWSVLRPDEKVSVLVALGDLSCIWSVK